MQEVDFKNLTEGLLRGERLHLSKAITLAETESSALFSYRDRLLQLAEEAPKPDTFRLAVTGVPGAGKSTLINLLGQEWIRLGHKVAVLAIDPSSGVSLGSILGDKTRMAELGREERAFIRPSPTRLHLGGVASSTFETIMLCEAAGYDRIIVETVGVGQSEIEASHLTDAGLLLLVTGTGDDLQGVKRGILEEADVVLVNKADGDNRERASAFARELQHLSSLWPDRGNGKKAEVLTASVSELDSILNVIHVLENFKMAILISGNFQERRTLQVLAQMEVIIQRRLEEKIRNQQFWKAMLLESKDKLEKPGASLFQEVKHIVDKVEFGAKNNS